MNMPASTDYFNEVIGFINSLLDKADPDLLQLAFPTFFTQDHPERVECFILFLLSLCANGQLTDPNNGNNQLLLKDLLTFRKWFGTEHQGRWFASQKSQISAFGEHILVVSLEGNFLSEVILEIWLDQENVVETTMLYNHKRLDEFGMRRLRRFLEEECKATFPFLLLFEVKSQSKRHLYVVDELQDISKLSKDRGRLILSRIIAQDCNAAQAKDERDRLSSGWNSHKGLLTIVHYGKEGMFSRSFYPDERDFVVDKEFRSKRLNKNESSRSGLATNSPFSFPLNNSPIVSHLTLFQYSNPFDSVVVVEEKDASFHKEDKTKILKKVRMDYTFDEALSLYLKEDILATDLTKLTKNPRLLILHMPKPGVCYSTAEIFLRSIRSSSILLKEKPGFCWRIKGFELEYNPSTQEVLFNYQGFESLLPEGDDYLNLASSKGGERSFWRESIPPRYLTKVYYELHEECQT